MKIIGMGVVAKGEADKYLKQVLDHNLPLVDKMVVWGDAPDKKTEKVLLSYGDKVEYHRYPESIWATKQWLIKQSLFQYVIRHKPDWVLAYDFDEIFDERLTREKLEELAGGKASSFYFNFIQLWNDEKHMRVDYGWGDFWNVRFFKFQPALDQSWQRKALHCGLGPVYAYSQGIYVPFIVKHYGYMDPADRAKKIERYKTHDPNRIYQSRRWYDSMTSDGDVREFNEQDYIERILPQLMPHNQKETKMNIANPTSIKKVYMVRRLKDGRPQEMSENQYKELTANASFGKHFALLGEASDDHKLLEAPVVEAPVKTLGKLDCECGYHAKTKAGLKAHQRKHEE